jgi:pSer/pThr/pTyr-binding forkhead associated (FHA) protein
MAKLKFLSGPLRGSEHDFDGELVIGRAESDLDIDDPQISRRHLRLRCVSGAVLVEDLDSSNGTFVDDRRLTAVATVRSTAIIGIGQTKFELIGSEARVDATQLASPDPSRTRITDEPPAIRERTAVSPPPPQPPRAAPPPPPPAAQAPPVPAAPIGAYAAVAPARPRRGPATRLLAPAALTVLIIVAVAAALLVYFATR